MSNVVLQHDDVTAVGEQDQVILVSIFFLLGFLVEGSRTLSCGVYDASYKLNFRSLSESSVEKKCVKLRKSMLRYNPLVILIVVMVYRLCTVRCS